MNFAKTIFVVVVTTLLLACGSPGNAPPPASSEAPLQSWNEGEARGRILDFVARVTDPEGPDFVPESERIAVFDNDGTLWSEKPLYFQFLFAMDRVRELAPDHPDWQGRQPFRGVLEDDLDAVAATGMHGLLELVMASHAGMTTTEFERIVGNWITTARHPTLGVPYTDLVFEPMLEVLDYLAAHGFTCFIVSGGGIEFMRPWVEEVYGIPPERVVGSSIEVAFEMRDDGPVLVRLPEIDFIDDKQEKPVGIHKFIGRRPIAAFGNSDGDLQMLQWTTAAPGERLGVIIHHTDAEREWAYDRQTHVGRLDTALKEAPGRNWVVVDMKRDWKTVHGGRSR
jgi:phosphoserine phosphatase